tara:strand:+ start:8023 stop:8820 length:798 start_codon:yes stop_codon:yes gene_type:complete
MGFFIPHRYAAGLKRNKNQIHWIHKWFSEDKVKAFSDTLELVSAFNKDLKKIDYQSRSKNKPRWHQDWFPGLDAAVAYSFVRSKKPKNILEIGSGHSTRFILKAIKDGNLDTSLTCVDPAPRAPFFSEKIYFFEKTIQSVDLKQLPELSEGDFLIIDSSHIAVSGSDVDIIVNQILPNLPKGVFVHFHDIFFPDHYPPAWQWREYNEQLVISALLFGGRFEPVFSSHFVRRYLEEYIKRHDLCWIPVMPGAFESSLWLEVNEGKL